MEGKMFGFDVVPFQAAHIQKSDLREHERSLITSLGDQGGVRLKLLEQSGPGWSMFKDELFITAGGVIPMFGVTGELWQAPSRHIPLFSKSYSACIRAFADSFAEDFGRLQTVCLDDDLHNRWMKFLGFQKESVMPRYGHDQKTYATFVRFS